MPDICKNDLTISGDAKELRKFLKAVRTDEHPFNFAGVHPPPERLAVFPDSCSDDEELTDAQLRQTAERAEDTTQTAEAGEQAVSCDAGWQSAPEVIVTLFQG